MLQRRTPSGLINYNDGIFHSIQTCFSCLSGILHARKANLLFQAVVPDSFQDREGRWHDDLINTYHQDSPVFKVHKRGSIVLIKDILPQNENF